MARRVKVAAEFVEWEGRVHVRLVLPDGRRKFARESFDSLAEAEAVFRDWMAEHDAVELGEMEEGK